MANILYIKQKRQVSYDGGITWVDTGEYRVGGILENPSNCQSEEAKQCRWVELDASDGYYCNGKDKYTLQVEECSTDGGLIWVRSGAQKQGNTLLQTNSTDCVSSGELVFVATDDMIGLNVNGNFHNIEESTPNGDETYTFTVTLSQLGYSNFTSANTMFEHKNIVEIKKMFDTSNVTDMHAMFLSCELLPNIDVSFFNTSKVTDMSQMFTGCIGLTSLDLRTWDVSNVTDMSHMFDGCSSLTSLDLSNWNVSNVTDMHCMFDECFALETLNVTGWKKTDSIENQGLFNYGYEYKLKRLILGEVSQETYDWWCDEISNQDMDCSIIEATITGDTPTYEDEKLLFTFSGKNVTYRINTQSFTADTMNSVANGDGTYTYSTTLTELGITEWTSADRMFSGQTKLLEVKQIPNTSNVTNMQSMFEDCSSLTSLDLSNWNVSNVTTMHSMFEDCSSLTSLDLSNWDVSNVTTMYCMFNGCSGLTSLDVSTWDVSNVTNMFWLFNGCRGLTSLDVSTWDVSNVTNMQSMFADCSGLTSLDLRTWDVSNVTNMGWLFTYCTSLTSLDLSNWNVSNVTKMESMFNGCRGLTSLDVSTWNVSNVTDMGWLFNGCSSLTTLTLGEVSQETYDWWYQRLVDVNIQDNVAIEYTLI